MGSAALYDRFRSNLNFVVRPVEIFKNYQLSNLQPDMMAGLTVAVVTIPQAMAFALIAELPPQYGLYSAIIGSIVGALWGSSNQLQTGPSNAASLLALSILLEIAVPGTPQYLQAAGVMAVMVGVFRLVMGVARLGMMVNFVSDSVIVGFTTGAGLLIFFNQLKNLFRLDFASRPGLWETLENTFRHITETHLLSLFIGLGTLFLILLLRRISRKIPAPLIALAFASMLVVLLDMDAKGVKVIGALPKGLPPFTRLPLMDAGLISELFIGSLAISAIGLVEAMSIARSISGITGQRLDSNQEFVGQGLANIACGFFSGYLCSGSFTRTAINVDAGAKTAFASVFGGLFSLLVVIAFGSLTAFVPLAALAGVLILTALRLIKISEMKKIWHSNPQDRYIMLVTLAATLLLPLQYAVISGILISLVYFLLKTSTPRVRSVLPDDNFKHLAYQPEKALCPQMSISEILGNLYFGAVQHVEESIQNQMAQHPEQRYLLLRMHSIEHCDISGIHALEHIVSSYRERYGDVFIMRVQQPVYDIMLSSGFVDVLGEDHFLDLDAAIGYMFHKVIDPAICIYECPVRAFKECQNLPKSLYGMSSYHLDPVDENIMTIEPRRLWSVLYRSNPPRVIDVREVREYRQGHIPQAELISLPRLLEKPSIISNQQEVVFVCRGGRRSSRVANMYRKKGYENVMVLRGGMLAWEGEKLLEALGET